MRSEILLRKDYTAEEAFWLHPPGRWELLQGKFVCLTSPTGALRGLLVGRLTQILTAFVDANGRGKVLAGDPGFVLRRQPDTVRAPDVAFLRRARVTEPLPEQYFEGAPDLAVEVLSPDDRWTEVEAKVDEYLAAGTVRVWVVDARRREVHVFGAGGRSRLGGEQVLEGEELLPGFRLPLSELFR